MSYLIAAWGLLPWWAWIAAPLAIIAITALGLWPVAFGFVRTIVKLIPWGRWETWAVIGVVLAAIGFKFWIGYHDAELARVAAADQAKAVAARDKHCQDREDESNARYRAALAILEAELATAKAAAEAAAKDLADALARAKAERARTGKELEDARSRNVTAQANAMCTLTRGVVVQFNAGARRANGKSPFGDGDPAAGTGSQLVDEPAGVSLDTYERAIEGTQDALATCRAQVIGWQKHYTTVLKPWISSTVNALNSCVPRGSSATLGTAHP
jgi:hypothetical protein